MSESTPTTIALHGSAASSGVAIGRAVVVHPAWSDNTPIPGPRGDATFEAARFRAAQSAVADELEGIADRAREQSPTLSSILETHHMIVTDPVLSSDIIERIACGVSPEAAVIHEFERQRRTLMASTNSMFRDRAHDLDHMKLQILNALRSGTVTSPRDGQSIVVADTVSPHEMLTDHHLGVRGYVMQSGGVDAHASIIARDFGLPAVVSVHGATTRIGNGDLVIIDGDAGVVLCNPDEATLRWYQERQQEQTQLRSHQENQDTGPAVTLDGTRVTVEANIDVPEQVANAIRLGAEGFGLVRTEMMIASSREIPSFDEQVRVYRAICQGARGLPITFRVFDFGGDKGDLGQTYVEDNPALGLRGIRFLLAQPEILRTQIRALLEVGLEYPLRCMLPMVSTIEELDRAQEIIEQCRKDMQSSVGACPQMPVGMMIETPAAALSAECFADRSDFFSIGTNDLTQYTLAVDRTNDLVSNSTDTLHPAVLRLISMAVDAAKRAQIPVTVCGEMAGHAAALEVLVGLGVTGVSVSSFQIHDVRRRIRELRCEASRRLAESALTCHSASQVVQLVEDARRTRKGTP